MNFYKRERLKPQYFTISSGNLVNYGLFAHSTEFVVIDPTSTGPSDILTGGQLNALKQTSSSDFSVLAASFTDSSWTSGGWDMSSDDSFSTQLDTWLSNNIINAFNRSNVVIMRGNVLGTDYTTVFTYPGNQSAFKLFSILSTGSYNSFITEKDTNNILGWGLDAYNQLGTGKVPNRGSPESVVGGRSFSQIAGTKVNAGTTLYSGGVGIEASTGCLWGWGTNSYGNIGNGTTNSLENSPVSVLGGRSFSKVSMCGLGCIALEASTGYAWNCGLNSSGQLGDGTTNYRSSPVSVLGGRSYSEIDQGYIYSLALEGSTGFCWVWGSGYNRGDGRTGSAYVSSPVSVLGNRSFSKIAAGRDYILAVEGSTGYAWCWGSNNAGELGDGTIVNKSSPVSVLGGRSFCSISCNNNLSLAIEGSTGNIYEWGRYGAVTQAWGQGEMGDGTTETRSSPVSILSGRSFSKTAGGYTVSFGIEASTGQVWSWGQNSFGQLGNGLLGASYNESSPISIIDGRSFSKIAGSVYSGLAIEGSTGQAFGWGRNREGQLGNGLYNYNRSPVQTLDGNKFTQVISGYSHTLAIETSTGRLWSWGGNSYGQLGNGTTQFCTFSPDYVLSNKSFSKINVIGHNSYAIEGSTGLAWAWGFNGNVQLGDGTNEHKSSPVSVLCGRSFSQLSWSCAIEASTGFAWAWGVKTGDGTLDQKSSPVSVLGGRSFSLIIGNNNSSCQAIEGSTGLAWYWGISPVSVLGGRSFSKLSSGTGQVLGLEASTKLVWSWGSNNYGELGDGTTESKSSPISILGGRTFSDIYCGSGCCLAVEKITGKLWAWGDNAYGQLGDGTYELRSSPISVNIGYIYSN